MDILSIVTLILIGVVLAVQAVILVRQGSRPVDEKKLREETEGVKNALRAETESIRAALNREIGQLRGEQTSELSKTREELNAGFERIRASVEKKLQDIQRSNEQKLEDMRKTVDEKLHKTLETRLGESFKTVSERLEQVHKGLGEMQNLAQGVGDLKKALTNVKVRGGFGEIQLERLLEEVFAPGQYEKNFSPKNNREQVEFALKLPNKEEGTPLYLPIDSKFPHEGYERLQEAYNIGDPSAVQAAQKELAKTIRQFAKDVKDKYIEPPLTTDFAILFLPTEGLYAEVLRIPGLVEELQTKFQINVTGPTTLLALLNALQVGFKTLAIEKRSGEVWEILGAVKREFETFGGVLEKTQDRIRQAGEEMEKLVGARTRQILRRLKTIESLPDAEQSAALLGIDDADDA